MVWAQSKKKKFCRVFSDNKNTHSTDKIAQQYDVTFENPPLRQTELGVPEAPNCAAPRLTAQNCRKTRKYLATRK